MTAEQTLLEAVEHSPLYITVDREVLRAHLQFVASERTKLNERITHLERTILAAAKVVKEGEENAPEGLGLVACSEAAKLLAGAL